MNTRLKFVAFGKRWHKDTHPTALTLMLSPLAQYCSIFASIQHYHSPHSPVPPNTQRCTAKLYEMNLVQLIEFNVKLEDSQTQDWIRQSDFQINCVFGRHRCVCVCLCGGSLIGVLFWNGWFENIQPSIHSARAHIDSIQFKGIPARKSLCPRILYAYCIQDMKCFRKIAENKMRNKNKRTVEKCEWMSVCVCFGSKNSGSERRSNSNNSGHGLSTELVQRIATIDAKHWKLYLWSQIALWV